MNRVMNWQGGERWSSSLLIFAAVSAVSLASLCFADDKRDLFTVNNADPTKLPTLGMWEKYSHRKKQFDRFISAKFPNVPDFTCDLWCYESDGITFTSGRPLDDGGVEMRHAWEGKDFDIVSTATPLPGCLDFVARLSPKEHAAESEPGDYPRLNICWQLRRAAGFASKPDPYPEFVKRCFVFTEKGRTFLGQTERLPIPVRPRSDKENNPPWVQMYLPTSAPADIKADAQSWADYSRDRCTLPVIGAVSRDGKYLAAMATGSENMMCQAWHDCMHNNARWLPAEDGAGKTWHVRIYVMENDPDALTARFKRDFPVVRPWD